MLIRILFILIVLAVIGGFAALNWGNFTTPTTLSLGVAVVEAPLGLVMLGLLGLMTALFLVFVISGQASALMETRRYTRELQAQRELADRAEASRLNDLRTYLETEMKAITGTHAESTGALQARLDKLEFDLRTSVEQSGNTLAAYIGELEDRLERSNPGATPGSLA